MTRVTGAAIEPVPLTELGLTGPQPAPVAGGHSEFGACHFPSLSGTHPQHKLQYIMGWAELGGVGG